ncbi:MAG: hypothetical protein KatS3mg081_0755 [Gemmatimonadales bacterium]|nr:hypothetical protein HRbin33_00022 [bacterium HR33]GIW51400.1 MAG: hypothetical protein KatS3mg081_0755 [Gemmatimonadales bacterium]
MPLRHSTVRLPATRVFLADLTFPSERVQIHRTRLAFVHLDNVLNFSKIDRDGRVDGYVVAYLPDLVAVLFLRGGELVTAVSFTESGRSVLPIGAALREMKEEVERGELVYADAPLEQLAWMYQSCAAPAVPRFVDLDDPQALFPVLKEEGFSGILELISEGRVNYFRFENGKFVNGYYCAKGPELTVGQHVESLFDPGPDGGKPALVASVFPFSDSLPVQASTAMIQSYRELFWKIVEVAEREVPQEGKKRAYKLRDALAGVHTPLSVLGTPLDREAKEIVTSPEELTRALADWTRQLLQQLEIIAPGVAPQILKDATREQRFVLQKAGFYQQLPWSLSW